MADGAVEIERELCRIDQCHVFRVPPRTGAAGYRASDWGEQIKVVQLRVLERGPQCMVALFDVTTNGLYARCPVRDGAVERATDSTRYFVLRVPIQQGKHAFLGIAFKTRDEAFDFNVALSDHQKNLEREQKIANNESLLGAEDTRDFRIQDGQKIHINIGGDASRRKAKAKKGGNLLGAPGGRPGGFLAPPARDTPSRTGVLPVPQPRPVSASSNASSDVPRAAVSRPTAAGDDLLNFSVDHASGSGAPAAAAPLDDFHHMGQSLPQTSGAAPSAGDPFGASDPFGGAASPVAGSPPMADLFGGGPPAPATAPPQAAADPFGPSSDPFGAAPEPAPQPAPAPAPVAPVAAADPFGASDPFGGAPDPFGASPAAAPAPMAAADPFGGGVMSPAPAPQPPMRNSPAPMGMGGASMGMGNAPMGMGGMGGGGGMNMNMGMGMAPRGMPQQMGGQQMMPHMGPGGMGQQPQQQQMRGGMGMGMGGAPPPQQQQPMGSRPGDPFAVINQPQGIGRPAQPPTRDPFGGLSGF